MRDMEIRHIAIGVDPGKDGAMAMLGYEAAPVVVPFDVEAYRKFLQLVYLQSGGPYEKDSPVFTKVFCVVEHVNAMPGQGVTSCFSFGENFGLIQGLLRAFCIPYELVRPQKWKREFSCTKDKNTSIEVAKRLFPGVSLKRTERCTKDHDGMAEALLMAEYARRHFNG